ncbi:MAG: hypothetical protein OEY28_00910, partial [Nitrospira sp.]|nr:hypothetical protein [Nitrospira sp.]
MATGRGLVVETSEKVAPIFLFSEGLETRRKDGGMKNLRRGSGLVLGLLWVLIADVATAGDYVLLVG